MTHSNDTHTARYVGYSYDGGKLFEAETAQSAGDKAWDWIEEENKPALGYVRDYEKNIAFPYKTYKFSEVGKTLLGFPHANIDEVYAWWEKNK